MYPHSLKVNALTMNIKKLYQKEKFTETKKKLRTSIPNADFQLPSE